MRASEAAAELDDVFAARDRASDSFGGARIGIFGNGAPEMLLAAAGALPVHLNLGTPEMAELTDIDAVVERFVDIDVRRFLNRLIAGHFSDYAAIVFARDDAPALTAYQYACEWVRQGRTGSDVPPLFLWNLVHSDTQPVRSFNRIQAARLESFLTSLGLLTQAEGVATAVAAARRRRQALARLPAVDATRATAWRNAGRFIPAERHADLLEAALDGAKEPIGGSKPRLGLIGSPIASTPFFQMVDDIGDLVCDAQPLGLFWPNPADECSEGMDYLVALAADPFCRRIVPTDRHREALMAELTSAGCELVISQVAETDDSFGWEVPSLAAALAAHGIGFIDLGFAAEEPSGEWLEQAAGRIKQALEMRS